MAGSDVQHIVFQAKTDSDSTALRKHFVEEPISFQVIDALWDLDKGRAVREKRCPGTGHWDTG